MRVLFLETDLGLRDLVGTALAAGSPEILTARSPEEVVRKLESGVRFDLLVIDEAVGAETLVRQIVDDHPDVAVVVATDRPTLAGAVAAIRAGARDYVEKPPQDPRATRARIRALVARRTGGGNEGESVEDLGRRNREFKNRATLLERKVSATQRNLREQILLHQRSREVFYTDLSRVMAIFDNLVDGIVFTDTEGKVILVNPAAGRMLETPSFTALGQPLAALSGDSRLLDALNEQRAWIGEEALETEVQTSRRGTGDAWFTVYTSEVLDYQGKVSGVLSLIRDVTPQKKTEKLKNQFLSIVAHELRTPLTAIKSFATILDRGVGGPLPEAHRAPVRHILTQTDRLAHEIDKIISLGRLEAEDFAPDLELVSVGEILKTLVKPFEVEAEKRGLRLVVADETTTISSTRTCATSAGRSGRSSRTR